MIAYKFLRAGAIAPFSGVLWPAAGLWVEIDGPLEPCANGIHACPLDALACWLDDELWTAELDGEILDEGTVLVAGRARLLAPVEGWPGAGPALAWACAERVRGLAGASPGNAGLRELADEAAEHAERAEDPRNAIIAAYAAAVGADLAAPGDFDAERCWQSRRLAALLGLDSVKNT